jgi:hypothetical protein
MTLHEAKNKINKCIRLISPDSQIYFLKKQFLIPILGLLISFNEDDERIVVHESRHLCSKQGVKAVFYRIFGAEAVKWILLPKKST